MLGQEWLVEECASSRCPRAEGLPRVRSGWRPIFLPLPLVAGRVDGAARPMIEHGPKQSPLRAGKRNHSLAAWISPLGRGCYESISEMSCPPAPGAHDPLGKIPGAVWLQVRPVVGLTDEFCAEHLDE